MSDHPVNAGQNRRRWRLISLLLAAALVFVACAGVALVVFTLQPRLLVVALGLEHIGTLESALSPQQDSLTLVGERLEDVRVLLPSHAPDPLTLTSAELGGPILGDASTPGETVYLFTVDESSLNRLLRGGALFDRMEGERYRNLEVDLQPGGLIVYGDIHLGLRWQRMGLLLLQNDEEVSASPVGIVLDRELYALPERGSLARLVVPAGREVQRTLRDVVLTGPLPGEAHAQVVRFHQDRVQILARATYPAPAPPDTGWQLIEPGIELRAIDVTVDPQRPTERLRIVRLDPSQVDFRVRYEPDEPRLVSAWGAETEALVVVNGGYFAPVEEGGGAIGLLVSEGQRWGTSLGSYAGMFAVTADGDVSVRWLRQWPHDSQEALTQAVQSFPVLIKPGGVMGFSAEAGDRTPARRTVVAQDGEGRILFVVAPRGYLSLHEIAVFLAESDLDIDVALNLDGGGSTGLRLAVGDAAIDIDSFTPVPSVITVRRR